MKELNVKRNILLYIVSFITVVLFAAVSAFCFVAATDVAHAEVNNGGGNNAGSDAHTAQTIVIDVNGRDPLPEEYDNLDDGVDGHSRERNNERSFRSRNISVNIARDWFGLSGTFLFDKDSVIQSSNAFSVSVPAPQTLVITAKELTEADLKAYFSLIMYTVSSTGVRTSETRVYFRVTVNDTFVQSNGTQNTFHVGYKLKNGAEVDDNDNPADSFVGGTHSPIITIPNNSTFTVDLGKYLEGRALFRENDNSSVTMTVDGSPVFWALNSVKNFAIESVSIPGLDVGIENTIIVGSTPYIQGGSAPIRISPAFTGSIHVKSSDVAGYNEDHPGKPDFWKTTHTMTVVLHQVGNSEIGRTTVYIPFNFAPANPQLVTIPSEVFRLNNSSNNTYFLEGYYEDENGTRQNSMPDQRAIVVRPEDLFDYAFPSSYHEMTFTHSATTLDGDNVTTPGSMQNKGLTVTRLTEEENSAYPHAYRIEADSNYTVDGSHNVTFTVNYYDGDNADINRHTIQVSIDVELYGGYTITFRPIKGKRAVEYNALTDDIFAIMRDRGYMLTKATSSNAEKLLVNFEGNILTLTPQVKNMTGEENIPVTLEFTNYKRQKITFDSTPVNVDVNAGSLFARFDDWEAGLIIAAICFAGLCLILFIVWLFIRALSKRRQEEMATQAPVSSYIVKLNSTIAQTQAQQRAAQTQALTQASQMLLGAGPTGAQAPLPDTLALASGVGGATSVPGGSMSQPGAPLMSEPQAAIPPDGENLEELIAKYITDEELLERIFTEKYEPKGMVRRTFFKSKDLQARELDKEKKRIIERYKTPMPMDEAIMSESEIQKSERASAPSTPLATSEPQQEEMFVLDFDPDSPLYVEPETIRDEFSEEKIDIETSPEEKRLRDAEHSYEILLKEIAELEKRLGKVESELDKAKSLEDELREKIAQAEADDAQYAKDIEDLEFKLASAKNKDKPIITRDIGIKEEKKQRNLDELERLRAELEKLLGSGENLGAVKSKLDVLQEEKSAQKEALEAEIERARAEFEAYQARLAQVRAKQELEAKVTELNPMLVAVNEADYEIKKLVAQEEAQDKERDSLKDAVAAAKAQIMGTSDFGVISDLNTQISDANARLSEIEKENTKTAKRKSELNIEFNAHRRKANEFIEKNEIPLEEVIKAEDLVIGNIELELLKTEREKDKEEAEKAVAAQQAVYDDLAASSGDVAFVAMDVASGITDIEEEIAAAQAELDDVNARMESATEDEKLMLMVEQGDKSDKVEELKAKLEQANVEGTKRKMEAQAEFDAKLEEARKALETANDEFGKACSTYDELVHNTNPVDLIVSGSGPISRDQKIIEAENYKKQLERQRNETEQARLAAQQAQEEAERIRLEAERAAEEARLEAERIAQEAVDAAEQARLEAEERARAEIEAAERAKQEAQDALAAEAEEAKRKALEESEEAKQRAMEESEEAKRKAQEESEEAKRKAQEEIEEMKRKAEEEAEAKRLEEENRKKEEEERQKADAARNESIAKKVAMRKEQIIAIRNEMKELTGDEDAKHLRERLYNIQLTYDEDERGSTELMDFYNKTMDDIQNAGEIARLKAENAKKPKRVVRKVTERVTRKPKRRPRPGARPLRPGARPAARAGARPGARPAARPGARPAGARPPVRPGARPTRPGGPTKPRQ